MLMFSASIVNPYISNKQYTKAGTILLRASSERKLFNCTCCMFTSGMFTFMYVYLYIWI